MRERRKTPRVAFEQDVREEISEVVRESCTPLVGSLPKVIRGWSTRHSVQGEVHYVEVIRDAWTPAIVHPVGPSGVQEMSPLTIGKDFFEDRSAALEDVHRRRAEYRRMLVGQIARLDAVSAIDLLDAADALAFATAAHVGRVEAELSRNRRNSDK